MPTTYPRRQTRPRLVPLSQEAHRRLAMLFGTARQTTQHVWLHLGHTLPKAAPAVGVTWRVERALDAIRSQADNLYAEAYGHLAPPNLWPYYPAHRFLPPAVLAPTAVPVPERRRSGPRLTPADYVYLVERLTLGYAALHHAVALALPAVGVSSLVGSRLERLAQLGGPFDRMLLALEEQYQGHDRHCWIHAEQATLIGNVPSQVRSAVALTPELHAWLLTTPPAPQAPDFTQERS